MLNCCFFLQNGFVPQNEAKLSYLMNSFLKSTEAIEEKPLKSSKINENLEPKIKIHKSSELFDLSGDFVTKQKSESEVMLEKPLKSLQINENQETKTKIHKSEEKLLLTNKNPNPKTKTKSELKGRDLTV